MWYWLSAFVTEQQWFFKKTFSGGVFFNDGVNAKKNKQKNGWILNLVLVPVANKAVTFYLQF